MALLKRSIALSLSAAALLAGVLAPAAAFADYYPYTCAGYDTSVYGTSYWNQNCTNDQGTLLVYVQVQNQSNTYPYRSPSDFTVFVSGANPSQQYFQGSQNGTSIHLLGSYSVTVQNPAGYNPSYSTGCSSTVALHQTQTCVISLSGAYGGTYYPPQTQYPAYPQYQYQQPVTYVAKYVSALPNTGFAPITPGMIVLSIVLLISAGIFILPYVRKTITAIIR